MKFKSLRKKYPKFIYENYHYKISGRNLEIFFDFKIESDPAPKQARYGASIFFRPKISIKNVGKKRIRRIRDKVLNNLIFHLGLIEIPSYWKATCSPMIEIKAGFLNKEQIKWWKDLIIKGMGQFFFENKIDYRKPGFITIKTSELTKKAITSFVSLEKELNRNKYLVPVGGGKDAIVTLEKLKKRKKEINGFAVNPTKAAKDVLKVAGIKNQIVVERKIDPALLKLNKKRYLNGHTPFTSVLSFLSVFCAVLFGYKNIVFSNEKSADEGNVRYLGRMINHQWSKSSEFERKFKNYCKKYLTPGVEYFSLLRPYTELEISRMFLKHPQYFSVFSSCNQGLKTGRKWCGQCPKCLFVYATLYPYLENKTLLKIFGKPRTRTSKENKFSTGQASSVRGKDIFENKALLSTMCDLMGQACPPKLRERRRRSYKPFECVGTYRESKKAFQLSLQKAEKAGKIPFLLTNLK